MRSRDQTRQSVWHRRCYRYCHGACQRTPATRSRRMGVIATNRTVTLAMAQQVRPIFTEVIAAPDFEPTALELLQEKKNCGFCE